MTYRRELWRRRLAWLREFSLLIITLATILVLLLSTLLALGINPLTSR